MAVSLQYLPCDFSTVANFKAWAQAISLQFAAAGWLQSSDTGQVNWSTISTVPSGANNYVYEIWQPNDGMSNFYLKVEYGNSNWSQPGMRFTLGETTNGAGTMTGSVIGPITSVNNNGMTTTTQLIESRFSYAPGRFTALLWNNNQFTNAATIFSIERSINSSGTYTNAYVTLYVNGWCNGAGQAASQQSYVFGIGAAPAIAAHNNDNGGRGCNSARLPQPSVYYSLYSAYNNTLMADFIAPYIGYYDLPITTIGVSNNGTMPTNYQIQYTRYGTPVNYLPTNNGQLYQTLSYYANQTVVLVRYD